MRIYLVAGTTGDTTLAEDGAFVQLVVDDDGRLAGWILFDYVATQQAEWRAFTTPLVSRRVLLLFRESDIESSRV